VSQREDAFGFLLGLGNVGGREFGPELDVAGRAHEGGNSTVSAVGSSAAALGSVDLDVLNDKLVGLELLGDGVGLEVLQQALDDLDRLFGPASLSDAEFAGLASSSDVAVESLDGHASLVGQDVFQVSLGFLDRFSLQHHSSLVGVFEVHTEVVTSGLDRLVGFRVARISLSHGNFIKSSC